MLILGGTTEGRLLADALADPRSSPAVRVTSSLAGRVARPRRPAGEVRVGGFGGVAGLAAWLRQHRVRAVIDATHPYAATMTAHAARACAQVGVPLLRLQRPGWVAGPADDWRPAASMAQAAALVDTLGARAFLTIGRQEVAAFAGVDAWCLVRAIEPVDPPLPRRVHVLLERGPFELAAERGTLARWGIDVLVSKDSGGEATAAKLVAAAERGTPVVMIERPPPPSGVPLVDAVGAALEWLRGLL